MYEKEGGIVVNFSSTYGIVSPDPRIYGESGINSPVAYAATKSGLLNMTRYMAVHWRPRVRVNVLAPGGVEAGQHPDFIEQYEARTPLARMARPEDYQGAILFLCSEASAYMTGSVLTVDGGWTAW
jgi:NAD(P)-dependent dehydrogenase (short-subunit alcohol dehydrogenase family)